MKLANFAALAGKHARNPFLERLYIRTCTHVTCPIDLSQKTVRDNVKMGLTLLGSKRAQPGRRRKRGVNPPMAA